MLGFRPLMGIIKFNKKQNAMLMALLQEKGFRPLMGIIKFNPVFETAYIYWF